jgi:hypothetical protein
MTLRHIAALTLLPSALLASVAEASPRETHDAAARVAYIEGALGAVAATSPAALREAGEYARVMAHGACATGMQRLKVECLMTAARKYCDNRDATAARRCNLTLDVIVSNVIADEQLITPERRYQIMRAYKDYRRQLAAETRRIEGALAVDFRLRMGEIDDDAHLAPAIDRFCLASADATSMAWPTCVSSLVWFIRGGSSEEAHPQ